MSARVLGVHGRGPLQLFAGSLQSQGIDNQGSRLCSYYYYSMVNGTIVLGCVSYCPVRVSIQYVFLLGGVGQLGMPSEPMTARHGRRPSATRSAGQLASLRPSIDEKHAGGCRAHACCPHQSLTQVVSTYSQLEAGTTGREGADPREQVYTHSTYSVRVEGVKPGVL